MCGGCCYNSHLSPRGFVLPSLSNLPLHHYDSCQLYSMYAAQRATFSWGFLGNARKPLSEIEAGISRLRGYIKMQSNIVQLFDLKLRTDNDWLLQYMICTHKHTRMHWAALFDSLNVCSTKSIRSIFLKEPRNYSFCTVNTMHACSWFSYDIKL